MTKDIDLALASNAWPFKEAEKLVKRYKSGAPDKGFVLFETGYGPSGLPHLGTFGEVARTTMVMRAFQEISDIPTKLICFSDDMDGLRKVPTNVPNQDLLAEAIGKPLTQVPDPFGTHPSFGEHNNARLQAFLDQFGFDYEFLSSTDCYKSGRFDETLLKICQRYDKVIKVILPTLGEERRQTYSPFLPICPKTGVVLQVPVTIEDAETGSISFNDSDGERVETLVTGGNVKCQWKVDWAMRWDALDVDYEMAGKDLDESVKLSSIIRRILGGQPPEALSYELFLDEKGQKISKSKGNGISIEEWLAYASPESLSLYMYQNPRKAKRLYFDVIPKAVDEYYTFVDKYNGQELSDQYKNPAWHIHGGMVPGETLPISFALLLNLVSAANAEDKETLWGFVAKYADGANAEKFPALDRLMDYALKYFEDFVKPSKSYRLPNDQELTAFESLKSRLEAFDLAENDAETIMTEVYSAGKDAEFENLREWFKACYEVLLGQSQGPRMGGFIALYGIPQTLEMIDKILSGEKLS
ncbi:lysine--tRNA ligase [Kordiimonas sp. SCSIO 12610]|uniref:lysine--tRNA ligase n=1 Tax=Kordiimonas sp. SCSIO 12610 TaxID=2829597 RepID=UPI00210E9826|nr:lysine--tRNA ligase [Kordiimonas sp. SCSIO 12610]UTW55494.1 lysine--tRNA ligase [Kordiimonas sp. SCSIO 12610]